MSNLIAHCSLLIAHCSLVIGHWSLVIGHCSLGAWLEHGGAGRTPGLIQWQWSRRVAKLTAPRILLPEDDDVLAGQHADRFHPLQWKEGYFLLHLCLGHFVERFNRHGGIFSAELDEDDAAVLLQRAADGLHHFPGVIELVIDV